VTNDRLEGLRERKNRELRQRVAEASLKLYVENGYDGTSLAMIAAAAGISPRTFFTHFRSKDETLFWHNEETLRQLSAIIERQLSEAGPFDAVRAALLEFLSGHDLQRSIVLDQFLESNETLRTAKYAVFVEMETIVLRALQTLWPEPDLRTPLEIIAMMAVGTYRLSLETWRREGRRKRIEHYVNMGFAALQDSPFYRLLERPGQEERENVRAVS